MSVHLLRELNTLRKKILALGSMVEENFQLAIEQLSDYDTAKTVEIKSKDKEVDRMEVEVEEECLKILALYQPVAADLRFIVSVLKLNNDLERIGDLAVNLDKKAARFNARAALTPAVTEIVSMARSTSEMLKNSLDALVNYDIQLANNTRKCDDEIDALKSSIRESMNQAITLDIANLEHYLAIIGAARNIERIADLVTNICEDVIYSVDGEIVRHDLA